MSCAWWMDLKELSPDAVMLCCTDCYTTSLMTIVRLYPHRIVRVVVWGTRSDSSWTLMVVICPIRLWSCVGSPLLCSWSNNAWSHNYDNVYALALHCYAVDPAMRGRMFVCWIFVAWFDDLGCCYAVGSMRVTWCGWLSVINVLCIPWCCYVVAL